MTESKAYIGPPQGVRVRPGDSVGVLAWSNIAFTLRCNVSFLRDGERDPMTVNPGDAIVTSNRAVSAGSLLVFTEPGVIQGVSFATVGGGGAGPTLRGQTYVQALLTGSGSAIGVYQTLSAGYFYGGWIGALGQIVEPGPAGGPGNMIFQTSADPAAGTEVADQVVPAGAIWKLEVVTVQLVQGITQTPLPSLEFENLNLQIAVIPAMQVAMAISTTAQLTWGRGLVLSAFTAVVGDEIYTAPLPDFYMVPGTGVGGGVDRFATLTDGIGANTNYGPMTYVVQEWVMPN